MLSSRALRDGEVFQVRIDKMVDKWAGSIEIGVTTHNPAYLQLPSTMTNLRSGEPPGGAGPGQGLREETTPWSPDACAPALFSLVTPVTTHPVAEACLSRGRGLWLAWDVQGFLVQLWEESRPSEKAGRASGFGGWTRAPLHDRSPGPRSRPLSPLVPLGTWMMTGNGVMHNGTTILDEYGHNLDRLKVGERASGRGPAAGGGQGGAAVGPAQAGALPDSSLQPPFFQGRGHGGRGAAGGRDPALLCQRDDSGPRGLERAPGCLRSRGPLRPGGPGHHCGRRG